MRICCSSWSQNWTLRMMVLALSEIVSGSYSFPSTVSVGLGVSLMASLLVVGPSPTSPPAKRKSPAHRCAGEREDRARGPGRCSFGSDAGDVVFVEACHADERNHGIG